MNALAAFRSAWRALTTNLMRSILTMLGIIIGVAAVITMIAVGAGAQQRVEDQIKGLGSNIMLCCRARSRPAACGWARRPGRR